MTAVSVGARVPRDRTILVAGMGISPAVLTNTVWALAHQADELMYDNYGNSGSGLLRNGRQTD